MSIRTNTDHQLSDLGKMLAVWPQRVRDPSQFEGRQGIITSRARSRLSD
ncbi:MULTISPECIES: hypothetical protein [Xanthomonas]|nr:hypothetical protein [Xanthomonas campestris]MCC5093616.1 hypothetical protein [Xanthomonas campestris pv. incanae]MEA9612974.1 hypothetical protein [Xanthomonas campestris pv. incanae]MEA9618851.1 hypothetical protein [Xanthomonas campestris pv. incanae]WDJ12272.1 hypothetical protein JH299_09415 [Xanthomonas campestris pv. incanae]